MANDWAALQGSAVSMPWVDNVAGILQTWYSGNEVGNALADVLYGKVNPAGRLPISLPKREQDIPAYLNDRSENGKIQCVLSFNCTETIDKCR